MQEEAGVVLRKEQEKIKWQADRRRKGQKNEGKMIR